MVVFTKLLMEISVWYIQSDMIKPSDNGELKSVVGSMKQKVLINDTILMFFIPPKVCKMTPKLRHIFGCEI